MHLLLGMEVRKRLQFNSIEHIWPQAIGIKSPPDFFVTDEVCDKCNHIAGIYADAKFLKSYIVKHARNLARHSFLDPKKPTASSVHFLGLDEKFPCPKDCVCECYAGPAGEQIYHVRPSSETDFDTYVGGNPKKQSKSKQGRVYVYLTADHPYWVVTAALSIKKAFPKSDRIILTKIDGGNDFSKFWVEPDYSDENIVFEVEYIKDLSNKGRNVGVKIDINFSNRFLAKVALGLGYKILGDEFFNDENIKKIQTLFKEANTEISNDISVNVMSLSWGEPKSPFEHFIKLDSMWIIGLMVINGSLMLIIVMPSGHSAMIEITNNPKTLDRFYKDNPTGKIYISIPEKSKFLGPYSGIELFNHSRCINLIHDIHEIQQQICTLNELPEKLIIDIPKTNNILEKPNE